MFHENYLKPGNQIVFNLLNFQVRSNNAAMLGATEQPEAAGLGDRGQVRTNFEPWLCH